MSGEKSMVRVKRDIKQSLGMLAFIWTENLSVLCSKSGWGVVLKIKADHNILMVFDLVLVLSSM